MSTESEIAKIAEVPDGWTVADWVMELRRKARACADVRKDLALIYMDAAMKCENDHAMKIADRLWQ